MGMGDRRHAGAALPRATDPVPTVNYSTLPRFYKHFRSVMVSKPSSCC